MSAGEWMTEFELLLNGFGCFIAADLMKNI